MSCGCGGVSVAWWCDGSGVAGERSDEVGHLAVTADPAELALGLEQARRTPAAAHVALVSPAFHVAGRGPSDGNHRLDHVRAGQRAGQGAVDAETADGEHLGEAFTQAPR